MDGGGPIVFGQLLAILNQGSTPGWWLGGHRFPATGSDAVHDWCGPIRCLVDLCDEGRGEHRVALLDLPDRGSWRRPPAAGGDEFPGDEAGAATCQQRIQHVEHAGLDAPAQIAVKILEAAPSFNRHDRFAIGIEPGFDFLAAIIGASFS